MSQQSGLKLKDDQQFVILDAPLGLYSAEQLKVIHTITEEHDLTIRATEDQRIGLVMQKGQLETVASMLSEQGLQTRDYLAGAHQPIACMGSFCPMANSDVLQDALVVSEKVAEYSGLQTGIRIGMNACEKSCVPTHTLDLSMIAEEDGYRFFIAGKNEMIPEMGQFLAEGVPAAQLSEMIGKVLDVVRDQGTVDESMHELVERVGLDPFVQALSPYSADAANMGDDPFSFTEDDSSAESEPLNELPDQNTDSLELGAVDNDLNEDAGELNEMSEEAEETPEVSLDESVEGDLELEDTVAEETPEVSLDESVEGDLELEDTVSDINIENEGGDLSIETEEDDVLALSADELDSEPLDAQNDVDVALDAGSETQQSATPSLDDVVSIGVDAEAASAESPSDNKGEEDEAVIPTQSEAEVDSSLEMVADAEDVSQGDEIDPSAEGIELEAEQDADLDSEIEISASQDSDSSLSEEIPIESSDDALENVDEDIEISEGGELSDEISLEEEAPEEALATEESIPIDTEVAVDTASEEASEGEPSFLEDNEASEVKETSRNDSFSKSTFTGMTFDDNLIYLNFSSGARVAMDEEEIRKVGGRKEIKFGSAELVVEVDEDMLKFEYEGISAAFPKRKIA